MNTPKIINPFRPGAGHAPPYLAGRESEKEEFKKSLKQEIILSNPLLTGLRGVGKTVLLEEGLKPLAIAEKWLWVGTDLSESASINEEKIMTRLLADLSVVTSAIAITEAGSLKGFSSSPEQHKKILTFETLVSI